jgi:hypothetical protein
MVSTFAFSQVGIGTQNPQQTLHIDGAKNNPTSGEPSAAQSIDDFVVKSTGQVGIGTAAPNTNAILDLTSADKGILLPRVALVSKTNPLPVNATAANIPVGLIVLNTTTNTTTGEQLNPNQLYKWSGTQWDELVDLAKVTDLVNQSLSNLGIPRIVFKATFEGSIGIAASTSEVWWARAPFNTISGSDAVGYSNTTGDDVNSRTFTIQSDGLYKITAGYRIRNNSGSSKMYLSQLVDGNLGVSDNRNICSPCTLALSLTSVTQLTVGQKISLKLFTSDGDPSTEVEKAFMFVEKLE